MLSFPSVDAVTDKQPTGVLVVTVTEAAAADLDVHLVAK